MATCLIANNNASNFPEIYKSYVRFTRMNLLLGGDIYFLIAQNTTLGWIVIGKEFHNNPLIHI